MQRSAIKNLGCHLFSLPVCFDFDLGANQRGARLDQGRFCACKHKLLQTWAAICLAPLFVLIDLGANQRGARLDQGRFCAHSSHTKLVRRVGWRLQLYSRIRYGA